MLKLRKNKKGFTLVELIVVIAIMAVLAGTIAGVTVTQLNKQTDKTNENQARTLAGSISSYVIDDIAMSGADDKGTVSQDMKDAIKANYGSLKITYDANPSNSGEFYVKYLTAEKCLEIGYKQKATVKAVTAVCYVTETGVVTDTKPAATTGGGTQQGGALNKIPNL